MKELIKLSLLVIVLFLTVVMSSWMVWYTLAGGKRLPKFITAHIIQLAQLPSITHGLIVVNKFNLPDERYIIDSTKTDGFQYFIDSSQLPQGKILVSTFDQKKDLEIKLLKISNGFLIKKWTIKADSIIQLDKRGELEKNSIELVHPTLFKDSSIVVNTGNLLLSIDSKNQLKWVNHEIFHHSIELVNDSTIWACSRIETDHFNSIKGIDSLFNDAIVEVNAITGKTIFKKSVADILIENGFQYLFAIGIFETDAVHLNQVYPATYNSKYWEKGDLLISLRHISTVLIYRPTTNKIIWLKTGPWSNQHSCSFIDSSKIMLFGNDVIRTKTSTELLNGYNQIYIYDFSNNAITTPYSGVMKHLQIKTLTGGRATYLKAGRVFIDETNNGKVYIIDSLKPLLKYTERIDATHIKMFNWNRFIPTE